MCVPSIDGIMYILSTLPLAHLQACSMWWWTGRKAGSHQTSSNWRPGLEAGACLPPWTPSTLVVAPTHAACPPCPVALPVQWTRLTLSPVIIHHSSSDFPSPSPSLTFLFPFSLSIFLTLSLFLPNIQWHKEGILDKLSYLSRSSPAFPCIIFTRELLSTLSPEISPDIIIQQVSTSKSLILWLLCVYLSLSQETSIWHIRPPRRRHPARPTSVPSHASARWPHAPRASRMWIMKSPPSTTGNYVSNTSVALSAINTHTFQVFRLKFWSRQKENIMA